MAQRCFATQLNRIGDELPTEYGKAGDLNKEIQRQLRLAEDIISFGLENKLGNPVAFVREKFKPKFELPNLKNETICIEQNKLKKNSC